MRRPNDCCRACSGLESSDIGSSLARGGKKARNCDADAQSSILLMDDRSQSPPPPLKLLMFGDGMTSCAGIAGEEWALCGRWWAVGT